MDVARVAWISLHVLENASDSFLANIEMEGLSERLVLDLFLSFNVDRNWLHQKHFLAIKLEGKVVFRYSLRKLCRQETSTVIAW